MSKKWTTQSPLRSISDVIKTASPEVQALYNKEADKMLNQRTSPIYSSSAAASRYQIAKGSVTPQQFHTLYDRADPAIFARHGFFAVYKPPFASMYPPKASPHNRDSASARKLAKMPTLAGHLQQQQTRIHRDGLGPTATPQMVKSSKLSRPFLVPYDIAPEASGVVLTIAENFPTPEASRGFVTELLENTQFFYEVMVFGHVSKQALTSGENKVKELDFFSRAQINHRAKMLRKTEDMLRGAGSGGGGEQSTMIDKFLDSAGGVKEGRDRVAAEKMLRSTLDLSSSSALSKRAEPFLQNLTTGFYGGYPVTLLSLCFQGVPSAQPPNIVNWVEKVLGTAVVGSRQQPAHEQLVQRMKSRSPQTLSVDFPRQMLHLRRVMVDIGRTRVNDEGNTVRVPVSFGANNCLAPLVSHERWVESTEHLPVPVPVSPIGPRDGFWTPAADLRTMYL